MDKLNQNRQEIQCPQILYEVESNFNHIQVVEEFPIRKLLFGNGCLCSEQSAINIEKNHENVFDYSILAMHSFLFVREPTDILVVGLGGGVVPRQIAHYFINANVDVVEIDPEVVNVAKSFFFFEETDKIKVHIGDAFALLSVNNKKYDMIILDAFSSRYIPFHLMSKEFFQYVYCVSKDESIIASNVCHVHPSFNSQINTMRYVFGDDMYRLDGPRNPYSTFVYSVRGGLKPIKVSKDMCHFLGIQPEPLKITEEIKSAKIFSLMSV